jgi:hypothetical protein
VEKQPVLSVLPGGTSWVGVCICSVAENGRNRPVLREDSERRGLSRIKMRSPIGLQVSTSSAELVNLIGYMVRAVGSLTAA